MLRTTISIICLVAAGAIFFMYTQPTYDGVKTANAQIAQYDEALQKASELQQLKQALLSKYNTFDPAEVEKLHKLLPDHVDNVRLILDIDSLAATHSLAMQNVVVSSSQSTQGTQTAIGSVSSSKQKYDSLTLKFTTQGTYETFRNFLGDLQRSLRIVDLTSLNIARASEGGDSAAPGAILYKYDVVVRTYWLK